MIRRSLALALLSASLIAGLFHAPALHAQGFRVYQPGPDCRLARTATDQPFYGVSWKQRRWTWHVELFALSNVLAETIHRTGHVAPWKSAVVAQVLTADVPHVIGLVRRDYPLNPMDVLLADPVIRSAPFLWESDHTGHRLRDHAIALVTFAALYAGVACWASP